MSYEEDCETIRKMQLPVTHYIYCPRSHAHWPDLGGVFGGLSLGESSPEERRAIVGRYMAEGRQVRACRNGPYCGIQPIYAAMRAGRTP